jgi:hypothetical protein
MQRVRRLFPLTRTSSDGASGVLPICERLDEFYEEVVERHSEGVRAGKAGHRRAI